MQVGDVSFQHPRAGSPVVMILSVPGKRFTLERFRRFTQVSLNNGTPTALAAATSPQEKQRSASRIIFIAVAGSYRQHNRPMNARLKFAHVPRENDSVAVNFALRHNTTRESPSRQTTLLSRNTPASRNDIIAPLTQRRHRKWKHAQAMKQVSAKSPCQHLFA